MRPHHLIQFSLIQRKTPFIIETSGHKFYQNYTFLQSNTRKLPLHCSHHKKLSLTNLHNYLQSIKQYSFTINKLQRQQIINEDLESSTIQQISKTYKQLKQEIMQQIKKQKNGSILDYMDLMYTCNIIDYEIWNQALIIGAKEYKRMNLDDKSWFLNVIVAYFNKYCYLFRNTPKNYKFVYRETSLNDLVDFQYFLVLTQEGEFFHENYGSEFGVRLNLMKNRMKIIQKAKKSVDLNFFSIKQNYLKFRDEIIANTNLMNLEDLVKIYQFYSSILAVSFKFIDEIQAVINKKYIEEYQSISQRKRKQIIRCLAEIWKNQGRHNNQMYQSIVRPYILQCLQQIQQKNLTKQKSIFLKNLSYNLIGGGITQMTLLQKISNLIKTQTTCKQDHTFHIISHILDFRQQKQDNKQISMTRNQIKKCRSFMKQRQDITFNNVQKFWHQLIKDAVGSDSVISSKYVCVYQIDILVNYKGLKFAFQVQGLHYNFKEDIAVSDGEKRQMLQSGKKKIKREILDVFGIKIINIHCSDPQPKIIMRFQDKQKGKKYIFSLLQAAVAKHKQSKVAQQNVKK